MNTGVILDTRVHGPYSRPPVYTAVSTGNVYSELYFIAHATVASIVVKFELVNFIPVLNFTNFVVRKITFKELLKIIE